MNNNFFAPDFDQRKSDPREIPHRMRCTVRVIERSYDDVQSKGNLGQVTRKFVYLIPDMSDEMIAFFTAWLGPVCKGCPLHPPAHFQECSEPLIETILKFEHPFNIFARAAVMNPSRIIPNDHHLFLMTEGLTRLISARPAFNGASIIVESQPGTADNPDGSPTDTSHKGEELPFEKKIHE